MRSALPRRAVATLLAFMVALLFAVRAGADGEAPGSVHGPSLGDVTYLGEIGPGASDASDDFVTELIRGEVLSVTVAPAPGSALGPGLTLLDPDGVDRTAEAGVARLGRRVSVRRLAADRTGRWTVRVSGNDGTRGAYRLTSRIRTALRLRFGRQTLGGASAPERNHAFEAVDGATLSAVLRVRRGGSPAAISAVAGPSGAAVPLGPAADPPSPQSRTGAVLADGPGAYTLTVGLDEGSAVYTLSLDLRPPRRPRGRIALSADEPRIAARARPLEGNSAGIAEIDGSGFCRAPFPRVWFGRTAAAVLAVSEAGTRIQVVPPPYPHGTVIDVTVENPDGQADTEPAAFAYAVPEPARLDRLTPATASVYAGARLAYTVALSAPAGFGGAEIGLAVVGPAGAVPATVTIPPGVASARFELVGAPAPAEGRIVAAWGDRVVEADLRVVALPGSEGGGTGAEPPPLPEELDLAGWTIQQFNSARTFVVPPGTVLRRGQYLVIGRTATKGPFEGYWGVTLGDDVVWVSGGGDPTTTYDDWPSINGSESFLVRDAAGEIVEGLTPGMAASGGENWRRIPGRDPGQRDSWIVSTNLAPGGPPTPGGGQSTPTGRLGVYLSEFSDTAGTGNYVYEFVELRFDGHDP